MKQILLAGSADRLASASHGNATDLASWFVGYAIMANAKSLTRLPSVMVIKIGLDFYLLST